MRAPLLAALLLLPLAGHPGAQTPAAPGAPAAAASRLEPDDPVPVHKDPHHRQLFQYGPMRILELQLPPGDRSWFHLHEWPVLYVTLSSAQMRTEERGGVAQTIQAGDDPATAARGTAASAGRAGAPPAGARAGGGARAAGAGRGGGSPRPTSTTSYAERPVVHVIENVGTTLVRAVVVVNETKGDTTRSEQEAGFSATPELTNGWFRAYRLTLAPSQQSGPHRHRAPVVLVQATAGTGRVNAPMRFELKGPGAWAFYDSGVEHDVHNTGSTPLEVIEVELRTPVQ